MAGAGAGSAISMVGQVAGAWISGVSTYKNSVMASKFALEDAELFRIESANEAAVIRDAASRLSKDQVMAYISSGVQFDGTALLVSEETRRMGEAEAKSVEFVGKRAAERSEQQAKAYKREGKAAIASAIFGSAGSVGSYAASK